MIEPSERLLWLVVLVAAIGALGLGVPAIGDAAPFVAAGLLLAVLADALLAGSPRLVDVRRALPEHIVEGRVAELALEVRAPRRFVLDVVDSLPVRALPAGAALEREHMVVVVGGGEVVRVLAPTTFVRRGTHTLGRVALRARGPLGLVRRRRRVALPEVIRVLPDMARIATRAERLLRGRQEGGRRRRALADGRELDALREYQRGDDPRLVAWKASARRGQLIVRKMKPESRQDVVVAVDVGRHMSGALALEDGGEPRIEGALTTALVLAAAALSRGDRAGLLAFAGDVVAMVPAAEGRAHLRRLAEASVGIETRAEESDYAQVAQLMLARQKRRSMLVLITDVLDEPSVRALAAAVGRVRGQHLPVVVAVGDPALARLSRALEEGVTPQERLMPLAAARLLEHRRKGLAALEAAGAVVVDAPAPHAAGLAVETYATLKAQGRL